MSEVSCLDFLAAAYDFDGTLAKTIGVHTEARLEAFQIYAEEKSDPRFANIPQTVHDEAHKHGHHSIEIIGWVIEQARISANVEQDAANIRLIKNDLYWQKAEQGLPSMPGAVEFVKWGRTAWADQGIVTSAYYEREIYPFITFHKLQEEFPSQNIVTADNFLYHDETIDYSRQKPQPDPYNLIIERFAISPEELIVFEDNSRGIESAKTAGAFVVAVANTHSIEEIKAFEPEAQPDLIAENFDHAYEMLWD